MRDYIQSPINLTRGHIDDVGDTRYIRLTQNVPDGFITELQEDLNALGFDEAGTPDGAFGRSTKTAVRLFQEAAHLSRPYDGVVGPATKNALLEWFTQGRTRASSPVRATASAPTTDGNQLISPRVPHFSQGDPRWADRLLGRSTTIARQGCAITCIAMALRFYDRIITPTSLDDHLDQNDGYVGDSVRWDVPLSYDAGTGPPLKYDRRTGTSDELLPFVKSRIQSGHPTIIRVDYAVDANLTYNHFVLGVGLTEDDHIILNDPATRRGDGYAEPSNENILQRTTRKQGYTLVQLDWYEPTG